MSEIRIDDIGSNLDRANRLLAGIGEGKLLRNALYNALSRAARSGQAKAASYVGKEYTIGSSGFKRHVTSGLHIHYGGNKLSGGVVGVSLTFAGSVIPLIEFQTRFGKNGMVSVTVKRRSGGGPIGSAFVAEVGGHTGIYERLTSARFPIEEKYGPSAAHMMEDEEVSKAMDQQIRSVFDERMDHEILRVLNGWGGR